MQQEDTDIQDVGPKAAPKNVARPHPDQKYINALLTNNAALLEELYQKYSGKIKAMVLKNNGNETEAADIFQEALLSIYRRAKAGNFILTCPFDAFIYAVCKNKWLSELHKRKYGHATLCDIEDHMNTDENGFIITERSLLQQARKDLFAEKFSELSESSKKLLLLSWSGKSMHDVAKILNVSYGYARKRKSQCMAELIALAKNSPKFKSLKW